MIFELKSVIFLSKLTPFLQIVFSAGATSSLGQVDGCLLVQNLHPVRSERAQ
jgi:hypothetical protein